MTGYIYAFGPCICCGQMFGFNPHRVPSSTAITGEREPVCRDCMTRINMQRRAAGQEPFVILSGAYEPQAEGDDMAADDD